MEYGAFHRVRGRRGAFSSCEDDALHRVEDDALHRVRKTCSLDWRESLAFGAYASPSGRSGLPVFGKSEMMVDCPPWRGCGKKHVECPIALHAMMRNLHGVPNLPSRDDWVPMTGCGMDAECPPALHAMVGCGMRRWRTTACWMDCPCGCTGWRTTAWTICDWSWTERMKRPSGEARTARRPERGWIAVRSRALAIPPCLSCTWVFPLVAGLCWVGCHLRFLCFAFLGAFGMLARIWACVSFAVVARARCGLFFSGWACFRH